MNHKDAIECPEYCCRIRTAEAREGHGLSQRMLEFPSSMSRTNAAQWRESNTWVGMDRLSSVKGPKEEWCPFCCCSRARCLGPGSYVYLSTQAYYAQHHQTIFNITGCHQYRNVAPSWRIRLLPILPNFGWRTCDLAERGSHWTRYRFRQWPGSTRDRCSTSQTAVSGELNRGMMRLHFCREIHLLSLAAHLCNLNLR